MKKKRIYKRYKKGKRGGQHYIINYSMGWGLKTTIPIVDYPEKYGYESKKKEISPKEFMEFSRKEALERTKGEKGYEYLKTPEKYEEVDI